MAGGRKKEPAKIILMKGKSHHMTKAELKKREEEEITVDSKGPNIPEGLDGEQRDFYIETYNDLAEYGLATHLESSVLLRFVRATFEYRRLTKLIDQETESSEYRQLLGVRIRVSDELRKCEGDLGMNVFSRMKAVAPKEEDKEPTKAEQLFGEL